MKKLKILLTAVVFAAFATTSCSDDDDDNNDNQDVTTGEIMARWNPTKTVVNFGGNDNESEYQNSEPECGDDYVQFAAAGVFNRVLYDRNPDNNQCVTESATPVIWTRSGNTLTITGGLYGGTFTITRLNNTELEFMKEDNTGGSLTKTTYYFVKNTSSN